MSKTVLKATRLVGGEKDNGNANCTRTRSEARAGVLPLVHVEIALEDTLLHSVGDSGLLGHLSGWRLHDSHALSPLVLRLSLGTMHGVGTRNRRAFCARAEVLCKVVAFACIRK